jgi:predicted HTH transcriptional regulator
LNGLGGFVVFGVSDKGETIGQQVTAKTLEDIALELRRIEPPAFPEIETVNIGNDKSVILIRVTGTMGTYCYDGRPYIRHGPTTQIMPREEYEKRVVDKFHAHRRWENELAPDWVTIEDLDQEEIQKTLQNAIKLGRMKQPSHTDAASILRGLNLLDDGRLINAAVAAYGKTTQHTAELLQLQCMMIT